MLLFSLRATSIQNCEIFTFYCGTLAKRSKKDLGEMSLLHQHCLLCRNVCRNTLICFPVKLFNVHNSIMLMCVCCQFIDWNFCFCHYSHTYLLRSCHTDKGTSRHFLNRWRSPHTTTGNQTFPSSSPCQVAPLFSCSSLPGESQDPVPQKAQLVWPLLGSSDPLYSAQSFP